MRSGGSVWLPTGWTEPVEIQLFALSGEELLGNTDIVVQVRRQQDGYYYDWTNKEFRIAASVSEFYQTLQEVSQSYNPGLYRLDTPDHAGGFNTSIPTNVGTDDIYDVTVTHRTLPELYGLPTGFEIRTGALADKIIALPDSIANAVWDQMQADHTIAGSFGDLLRRIVALQKENYVIDQTNYNTPGLLTSGRIRLFNTKAEVAAATDGSSGEGEFATYSFTTTSKVDRPERADIIRSARE